MLYNVITIYLFNIQIYTFFLFEANIVSLDNTGGASEKQIEQALCFSLSLHYICNRKKLLK